MFSNIKRRQTDGQRDIRTDRQKTKWSLYGALLQWYLNYLYYKQLNTK